MLNTYILCGGLGSRLGLKYSKIPKCLIKFNGKSFLYWQLSYLEKQKVKSVVLCTGHLSEMIREEIKKFNLNLRIKLSDDGNKLIGTGGAIKKAIKKYNDKKIFVMYGDSYLRLDLNEFKDKFNGSSKNGMMAVIKNRNKWDTSNVYFKGESIIIYNKFLKSKKFDYIDYGVSALNTHIFDNYPENKNFDLSIVLNDISLNNNLEGYKVVKRFYQIGNNKGLKETSSFFRRKLHEVHK